MKRKDSLPNDTARTLKGTYDILVSFHQHTEIANKFLFGRIILFQSSQNF